MDKTPVRRQLSMPRKKPKTVPLSGMAGIFARKNRRHFCLLALFIIFLCKKIVNRMPMPSNPCFIPQNGILY
jgi:hypothetical protein